VTGRLPHQNLHRVLAGAGGVEDLTMVWGTVLSATVSAVTFLASTRQT